MPNNGTDPNDKTVSFPIGGDLVLSKSGGLEFATGEEQVNQRIMRRLFTSPAFSRQDGEQIPADYLFDTTYGIGLNKLIGELGTADFLSNLRAAINAGVIVDQSVDATQAPVIEFYTTQDNSHDLVIAITYTLKDSTTGRLIISTN